MLKENKKIITILGITILLLTTILLTVFPTSHSKYIDIKPQALTFENNFYTLNKGNIDINLDGDNSKYDQMRVYFMFNRNDINPGTKKDVYTITIPNSCTVNSISTKGTRNINGKTITISYSNNTSDINTIYLDCAVNEDPNNDIIKNRQFDINVEIKEKVGSEASFVYVNGLYRASSNNPETIDQYWERFLPPLDRLEIPKSGTVTPLSLYEQLKRFLNERYLPYILAGMSDLMFVDDINKSVNDYIESYNPATHPELTVEDFLKMEKLGLDITDDGTQYTFMLEENFIGYALTFEKNDLQTVFFSTTNESIINNAFEAYLKHFYSLEEDYLTIKDYLAKFTHNISDYILNGLPNIMALSRIIRYEGYYQINFSRLLEYARHSTESPVDIEFNETTSMRNSFFTSMDTGAYGPDSELGAILSDASRQTIKTYRGEIYNSVIKNHTVNGVAQPTVAFNDYFILYDEEKGYYLIVRVFSNGQICNHLNIEVLSFNSGDVPGITFTNKSVVDEATGLMQEQLEITITASTNEKLKEVIASLNDMLVANAYAENIGDELTSITYTVDKIIG